MTVRFPSAEPEPTPTRCQIVGALVVNGGRVAWLRCELDEGHHLERVHEGSETCGGDGCKWDRDRRLWVRAATPHQQTLVWEDPEGFADEVGPEMFDPDEEMDVEVDELPAGTIETGDGELITPDQQTALGIVAAREAEGVEGQAIGPDCHEGKHMACDGRGWDFLADIGVPCRCECHTTGVSMTQP